MITLVGIDPGIVHTGVVDLQINQAAKVWLVRSRVVAGLKTEDVKAAVADIKPDRVFIEAYRPRSNFDTDSRMGEAINIWKHSLPNSSTVLNTGVKKVIGSDVMKLLGMWRFALPTHHQDLRSAARILLYGAYKDEDLNAVLYEIVTDQLSDTPQWKRL